jgi:hypothetical protein
VADRRFPEDPSARGDIGKSLVALPEGGKRFYVNSHERRERCADPLIQELVMPINQKSGIIRKWIVGTLGEGSGS